MDTGSFAKQWKEALDLTIDRGPVNDLCPGYLFYPQCKQQALASFSFLLALQHSRVTIGHSYNKHW